MSKKFDFVPEDGSGLIHFADFGYFPESRCNCSCCENWCCDCCLLGWVDFQQAVGECYDDNEVISSCCICPDFYPDTLRFEWRSDGVLEVCSDV